jgi:hypothetical protein
MPPVEPTGGKGRPPEGACDALVRSLGPRSVLVTGGRADRSQLVHGLRDRHAEVTDIDADALRLRASGGTSVDDRYDLVICIDPPGLPLDEAASLAAAVAVVGDTVLLSLDAPDGAPEHAPPDTATEWPRLLAEQGMFRDFAHDAGYLSPSAMLYRRSSASPAEVVQRYEHALHSVLVESRAQVEMLEADRQQLRKEVLRVRDLAVGRQAELASALARVEELESLFSRYDNLEHRLQDILESRSWRMTQTVGLPLRKLRGLR